MYDWIKELIPGDRVFVDAGAEKAIYPRTVKRITKTQVILAGINDTEAKFRVSDGQAVGDHGWRVPFLVEATPERFAKYYELRDRQRFEREIKDLTIIQVRACLAAIEATKGTA
jgi:hypothetical protein